MDLMELYRQQDKGNAPEEGEEYQAESMESSDSTDIDEVESEVAQKNSLHSVQKVLGSRSSSTGPQNSLGKSDSSSKANWKSLFSEVSTS